MEDIRVPKVRWLIMIALVSAILLAPGGAWAYSWSYNPDTTHYYATTSANASWEDANLEAQAAGGHLVTINNAAEETWLRDTFDDGYTYWIGFTDRAEEGKWIWASGEAVTYTHWAGGEPNNLNPAVVGKDWIKYYTDAGEDYAIMNWIIGEVAYWNDVPNKGPWFAQDCGGGVTGIIEVARVSAPLPSTLLLLGPVLGGLLWRCRRRR
jgi:hypothetical protein